MIHNLILILGETDLSPLLRLTEPAGRNEARKGSPNSKLYNTCRLNAFPEVNSNHIK